MIKFVTFLSVFSVLICISNCIGFCDVKTMDNVFNIGHYIYATRCGEVWTYDPHMKLDIDNRHFGGFLRDYFWQTMARDMFDQENYQNNPHYKLEDLHFAAFSFQELECKDPWFDMKRHCIYSTNFWNGWSVMASNWSVHSFQYIDGLYKNNSLEYSPYNFRDKENYYTAQRNHFWPNIALLAPQFHFPRYGSSDNSSGVTKYNEAGRIHSALFFKEDYRLFIGMRSIDGKYFCITHLNMYEMITDSRKWPRRMKIPPTIPHDWMMLDWAPAYCFVGNLVGMFSLEGRAYAVGRITGMDPEYEDQVYSMNAIDGSPVILQIVMIEHYNHPYNLRTFLGCDLPKKLEIYTEPPGPPTTCRYVEEEEVQGRPPVNYLKCTRIEFDRKKRSIEEIQTMIQSIWDDMKREVRDDWILLSLMSFIALFMIFIIFNLKKN